MLQRATAELQHQWFNPLTSFVDWEEIRQDREHTWLEIAHTKTSSEISHDWLHLSASEHRYKTQDGCRQRQPWVEMDSPRRQIVEGHFQFTCACEDMSAGWLISLISCSHHRKCHILACQDGYPSTRVTVTVKYFGILSYCAIKPQHWDNKCICLLNNISNSLANLILE